MRECVFVFGFVIAAIGLAEPVVAQDGDLAPTLIAASISRIYTPTGFDDNDNTQIIVEGEFPSTCYKLGPARVNVNVDEATVTVSLKAYYYQGMCLQVKTPYLKAIDLGILPEGTFKVQAIGATKVEAALSIHHTDSKQADDYLYAPVDAVFIQKNEAGDRRNLFLIGSFTNSCMKFSSEQNSVVIKPTKRGLLEVLPVVEMKEGPCLDVMVPFTKVVEIDESIPSGKYLFHVRTLNGHSYNKIDYVGQNPATKEGR